jgi:hypothetical protein
MKVRPLQRQRKKNCLPFSEDKAQLKVQKKSLQKGFNDFAIQIETLERPHRSSLQFMKNSGRTRHP